jgi:hypothetical protein
MLSLSISDYNDLLGFKPKYLPADPRVVDGDGAATVLSAILGRDIDDDEFPLILDNEGQRKYRRHLAVERSASNRQKVLAAKGYVCEACGFNRTLRRSPPPAPAQLRPADVANHRGLCRPLRELPPRHPSPRYLLSH